MILKKMAVKVIGVTVVSTAAFAAAAYACTALATLNLSTTSGPAGTTVAAKGAAFSAAPGASPVTLRLDKVDGPVLAQAVPTRGTFTTNFAIPQGVSPGPHVIVATQQNARGQTVPGTPARAPFQVNGANGQPAAPAQPAAEPVRPAADGSNGTGIAIGAIGLMLFAGGFVTFLVARRQSGRGAGARVGRS